jgi:hypothetical protein
MESKRLHEDLVSLTGFIFVAGILYLTLSAPMDVSAGDLAVSGVVSCCDDCSCNLQEVCSACSSCIWTDGCNSAYGSRNTFGMELIHTSEAAVNSTFILNIIVYPDSDGKRLVEVYLPNGFTADRDSAVVDLYAGELKIIPFKVHVDENAAGGEHTMNAELVDADWNSISTAEGKVGVY